MKQKINCRPVDILERKLKYLPFSLCCIFSLKAYKQRQGFLFFCLISHSQFLLVVDFSHYASVVCIPHLVLTCSQVFL